MAGHTYQLDIIYYICIPKIFDYGSAASMFVMFSYNERTYPRDITENVLVSAIEKCMEFAKGLNR